MSHFFHFWTRRHENYRCDMHVLFVCNGNVCRSVIAERLARAAATEHGLTWLTAGSAGTRALVGFPAEPLAAETIAGLGADADGFRARKLAPDLVDQADLVLAMTESIRDQTAEMAFGAGARTFTLLQAHRIAKTTGARTVAQLDIARNDLALVGQENIADPVGLSASAYCEVGDRIAETLLPLLLSLEPDTPSAGESPGLVLQPSAASAPHSALLAAQRIGWHT